MKSFFIKATQFKTTASKSRGFTLIEFLVVLAFIGIALGYTMVKLGSGDETSRAQIIQEDLIQIVGAAKNWKGIRVSYAGITFAQLTGQTFLRADWAGGVGVNPEGGNYTVAAVGQTVQVAATGLAPEVCAAVQSKMIGSVENVACAGTTVTVTAR